MRRISPWSLAARMAESFASPGPGQSSCLSITAGRDRPEDAQQHRQRKLHAVVGERVVLHAERHVLAQRLGGHLVVGHRLVVGPHGSPRPDHHAGGTQVHHAPRELAHGGEARRGDAHDHRHPAVHAREHPLHVGTRLVGRELGRFAHHAQDGEAGHAAVEVEVREAVGALEVERAIVPEGRHGDEVDALGGFVESGHGGRKTLAVSDTAPDTRVRHHEKVLSATMRPA